MNKFILVLALLLTPFFLHANIFVGSDTKPPDSIVEYTCNGVNSSSIVLGSVSECANWAKTGWVATRSLTGGVGSIRNPQVVISGNSYSMLFDYCNNTNNDTGGCFSFIYGSTSGLGTAYELPPQLGCPNQQFLDYTFGVDIDSDGSVDTCANPATIPTFDTCNINDSLNVQVTDANACYTKSDGSQCSVSSVDVGGGNNVYMGSEGNCYSDPKPDVTGNDTLGQTPTTNECVNNGGLLACPANPADVCGTSGTTYGGGSVNNCQSGCGYVGDEFICYDTDIDSDGLPDYNDPDIDGDGIPNKDDLDSDGNGQDDPINSGNGTSSGGGVSIDIAPVVSKLDEIKKSVSETAVELQTAPKPDLTSFWESEYENGLQGVMDEKLVDIKSTEFFTFIDQFNPSISGGTPPSYDMCFNLGSLGNFGCHNFDIDPRTFPAIKIFILVSAGFLCRRILFGG